MKARGQFQILNIKEYPVYKSAHPGVSNVSLPANGCYDFDNPLVAIEKGNTFYYEFNFLLKSGEGSNPNTKGQDKQVVYIDPADSEIAKIVVNYVPVGSVRGVNFYNRKGIMVLAVGISNSIHDYQTKVINL